MSNCRLVVNGRDLEVTRAAPRLREITSGDLPRGNHLSPRMVSEPAWKLLILLHGLFTFTTMDDVVDDDNIDLEELQAQIDLTLANTQNLVASWIDPNYGPSTSKQTLANQEKEIEELLKRPPRYA